MNTDTQRLKKELVVAQIFCYVAIATLVILLMKTAYHTGLYVGERNIIVQALDNGALTPDFSTGTYRWTGEKHAEAPHSSHQQPKAQEAKGNPHPDFF